ncbi:hypothetical protein HT031_000541 [Scenedesmus sp. PABB004]|nr:hypothetical protein HT031_000541 [Scenedesmus sp. PABB004]
MRLCASAQCARGASGDARSSGGGGGRGSISGGGGASGERTSSDARNSEARRQQRGAARRGGGSRSGSSRRALLAGLAGAGAGLALPRAAQAAVPDVAPAPGLAGALARALPFPLAGLPLQPEPVRFPRGNLDQRFAVLLMRSGYDAMDALDFVPRQTFEANFWKLRQSELEGYNLLYAPLRMRQGDLTDPLYLDFISFAQYAAISQEMRRPAHVFQEYYEDCQGVGDDEPCESGTRTVTRPPQFDDDAALPQSFFRVAGDLIYDGLRNGFRGEQFGGPPPAPRGADVAALAAGAGALLDVMVGRGYALRAEVGDVAPAPGGGPGGGFTVRVTGPCNLWSMAALGARRALVTNAYDVMAVDAWLHASGRAGAFELQLTESGLEERWTVA